MADQKITELDAVVTPIDTDLLATVQDVSTTPVTKKSTWTVIKAFLKTYFDGLYVSKGVMAAGDYIIFEAFTEQSHNNSTPTKMKEITVKLSSTYSITWQQKSTNGTYNAYAKVYKNGVAYGAEHGTKSTTYVNITENLAFGVDDAIQLYIYNSGDTVSYIKDFKVLLINTLSGEVVLD